MKWDAIKELILMTSVYGFGYMAHGIFAPDGTTESLPGRISQKAGK